MISTNPDTMANDGLKVANEATINNFKQTFNQFIGSLKDSSTLNLFVNPSMKHIMGNSGLAPFEWNVDETQTANVTFNTATTGPTQILFNNPSGASYQSVFQIINQCLKPNTEYTISFTIMADAQCEVSLNQPTGGGLSDLRNNGSYSTVFQSTYNPPSADSGDQFSDYFQFVTSDTINSVEFHVANINPTVSTICNTISIMQLHLFEGPIEFTAGLPREDFITNVNYSNGVWQLTNNGADYRPILTAGSIQVKYVAGVWQITNDGSTYRNLLAADNVDTTGMPTDGTPTDIMSINLDGKVDSTLFYKEHDDMGRHTNITLVDPMYKIAYQLGCLNGSPTISNPSVYLITPTIAHNGGLWDGTYQYQLNNVITYNNLKWSCIQVGGFSVANIPTTSGWSQVASTTTDNGGAWDATYQYVLGDVVFYSTDLWICTTVANMNMNHDPDIYSDWWQNIPQGVSTLVDNSFPATVVAFYTNHIQTPDSTNANNGVHAFTDTAHPATQYTINLTSGVPALAALVPGPMDMDVASMIGAYMTQHDATGEHVFHVSGVDYRLQMSVNHSTGVQTMSFVPYTKSTASVNDLTFEAAFNETSSYVFHDALGNHYMRDTDGLIWLLTCVNGAFVCLPTLNNYDSAILTQFNWFKQEHDKYGKHVLRDTATGVFYHIYANGTALAIEQTVLEPMTDITQFLATYNIEHDINGNHSIRTQDLSTNHVTSIFAGAFVVAGSASTPIPKYHAANAMVGDSLHQNVNGNIHQFHITGGILYPN
jgi:hypothetical protein